MDTKKNGTRLAAVTTEQLIYSGRCLLYAILPELTTTGTITVRDGAAADASGSVDHVAAIGLTQLGKDFKGYLLEKGLTVQLSVATDLSLIVWEPYG